MSNISALVDRYIATWNEPDPARRTELVSRTFTPSARYVDPLAAVDGHAAIAQLIGAVQGQFPGFVFTRRGATDAHGTFARFAWSLGPVGGPPVAGGTDFATLDGERFAGVTGFLDASPPPAPRAMFIPTRDGEQLYFTDSGPNGAPPVVFAHSWALQGAMWTYQVAALREAGLRCITFDRRGHGRSSPASTGFDIDTLADDLAAVLDALDLRGVTLVGHSTGGAEIVRYIARHGSDRVARLVLLAPTTPRIAAGPDHPEGRTLEASEALWAAWAQDLPAWVDANKAPFFTPDTSPAMIDWIIAQLLEVRIDVAIALDRTLSTVDLRDDLAKIDRPTLIIHGDRDMSVPLALGRRTAAGIRGARLSVYEGAPHGLFLTHMARVNRELIAFAKA